MQLFCKTDMLNKKKKKKKRKEGRKKLAWVLD